MAQQSTFIEEMMAAGRGVLALLTGNRTAGSYFDFSQRGLVGSFIALLIVTALSAVLPIMLGRNVGGAITEGVLTAGLLLAVQILFSAIVLRQLKRLDGLVPYIIADNWVTFFVTLVTSAIAAAGLANDVVVLGLGIVSIFIQVNIARFIVTLAPLQIAMFIIARLVGVAIALLVLTMMFPSPELLEAMAAMQASGRPA